MKKGLSLGFYFNAVLLLIIACTAFYLMTEIRSQEQQQAIMEAENKAKIILDRNIAIHTYFSHKLKPAVFGLTESVRSKDYFDPVWMSSSYAVREMEKNFHMLNDEAYKYKECSVNARNPENEADEFEKSFIEDLKRDRSLKYLTNVRMIDGKPFFVTLRRGEVLEESCLRCHGDPKNAPGGLIDQYGPKRGFGKNVNDIVSAISIRVPLAVTHDKADRLAKRMSLILIAGLLIVFVSHYVLYRFIVKKPINNVVQMTKDISLGGTCSEKDLPRPVSRELRELTDSFTEMAGKLRHHLDHLEDMVKTRTAELTASNEKLQAALDEIRTIKGIIPICMYCKGIRDDKGSWKQLERYISEHSDAQFSHSICTTCMEKYYPEESEDA